MTGRRWAPGAAMGTTFALLIGWIVLGEQPVALALVGGVVALGGVALVNAGRTRARPITPVAAPEAECA